MALDVEAVIDRRRLARRAALWRALAILVTVAAVVAFTVSRTGVLSPTHVARVPISGAIVAERPLLQLLERLRKDPDVAGVLVSINSPGGTSVGGERLYNALREVNEAKPMVAHIATLGASAAYMAALASDHIVAQRTALTGSVGVLIQYGQVNRLLDNLGIEIEKVESGALKAEPSPFEPAPPEAIALLQSVVEDTFDYFLSLVQERRDLSDEEVAVAADGRIFTGKQALDAGLVDALGGERSAIAWMEEERDLASDLPVRTYTPSRDVELSISARVAGAILDRIFAVAGVTVPPIPTSGSVDGLWSLWQVHAPSDK